MATLCCHVVLVAWPICSWFFPSFQWSTLRSTSNSLLAGLLPLFSKSTPPSSGDSVAVTTASSGALNSLPNKITVTVAHALQHSLLTFVSTLRADNHASLVSSAAPLPPSVLSLVSSTAMVWPHCATRQGICGRPRSCALSCEIGEKLLAATLWS